MPSKARWKFERDREDAIEREREEEELSLDVIDKQGARARSKRVARVGLSHAFAKNQEMSQKRKDAVQYRACRALLWDRERILLETGWSLQWFMSVEKWVADEDRRIWSETDSRNLFAVYREQQLQIASELEDLSEIFRRSKQFSALVSALRTRADVLDRIVKTGQDLGVIHKTAKQVEVSGAVDVTRLDVVELRVHLERQVRELNELLGAGEGAEGHPAASVMRRIERQLLPAAEEPAEEAPRSRRRRVVDVEPDDGGST